MLQGENEQTEDPLNVSLSEIPEELQELLPEEIMAALRAKEEDQKARAAALTQSLISKRQKAVDWRASIGIEEEWQECDDAYEGIDDANRATERTSRATKPRTDGGPIISRKGNSTRSTVFLNITRPYTDAAAARVADMLLPNDDTNFKFEHTPIPDLVDMPDEKMKMLLPRLQQMGIGSIEEFLELKNEEAKKRAEKAQKRVEDWLVECQYHAEARKMIEECARLGTGAIKGPVPSRKKRSKVSQGMSGEIVMETAYEIVPESKFVSVWNIFPDPDCGEDIHNGSHLFERDRLSAKQLRELKDAKDLGYNAEEIQLALDEGPSKINISSDGRKTEDDDRFEVWYFNGQVSQDDFEVTAKQSGEKSGEHVNVVGVLVNDRLIKISKAHLDSGDFPYDLMPWQRRTGMPFGIGLAKQINVPQRMVNGGTRQMNDNSGLSSAPQIVMFEGVVTPADGVYELRPGKVWHANPDSTVDDVRKAFISIEIPTRQAELMNIIQFALKMAEDVTGLPMLLQGQQGSAPDTLGGQKLANNNANTVLRRTARLFDDCSTTPGMRRYYEWIMLYCDESEKGDYQIQARASTALVERDIQAQAMLTLGEMVINPVFGADPKAWFKEMLKSQKIDPKLIMLTPEAEQQLMMEQQQAQQAQEQQAQQESQAQQDMQAQEIESKERMQDKEIQKDVILAREGNSVKQQQAVAKFPRRQ